MAAIKSYTDLEQSKKMAEILPLESADMWRNFYSVTTDNTTPQIIHIDTPWVGSFNWNNEPDNIPCWSLAALLDILYQVKEIKHQRVTILVGGFAGQQWYVEFVKVQDEKSVLLEHSKELVDACYEMIIKLHEHHLL